MYKKGRNFLIVKIIGILFIILIIIIGFNGYRQSQIHNKNIKSIHAVINNMFNCPNMQIIKILNKNENSTNDEIDKEYNKKIYKIYNTYFTEDGFIQFKEKQYPNIFHVQCYYNNYKLVVNKIKTSQDKKNQNSYNVSIILSGNRVGYNKEKINLVLTIRFDSIGKIGYISILKDSEKLLSEKIKGIS